MSDINAALVAIATADHKDIQHLRAAIESRAMNLTQPGDRVRLAGNLRPRYLQGVTGTMHSHRGQKVRVTFTDDDIAAADARITAYLRPGADGVQFMGVPQEFIAPAG